MAYQPLNNVEHKELRVDSRPLAQYGLMVNRAIVHTPEFPELHKTFPLLIFTHPETGEMATHAILGLERSENLFIADGVWQCAQLPAELARGPFAFSHQRQRAEDGREVVQTLMLVDTADPRCNAGSGEQIFLPQGGDSPCLERIKRALQTIELGINADKLLFRLLQQHNLLEPVKIQVQLNAGMQINFASYQTINLERLQALDGNALHHINQAGFLGSVFYLLSSLSNFNHLIALKNARPPTPMNP